MLNMKKKLIVFDMDGVLFDSVELVNNHVRSLYDGLSEDMMKELLTGNFHEEAKKIEHMKLPMTDDEKEAKGKEYMMKKSVMPMYPGAREFLVEIKNAGYKIALNTAAYERNTLPLLENNGVKELFDFIGTAEVSKSKAEKFGIIEKELGVKNENTLFITDTLGDLREADEAGVPTICVTWGVHDIEYFTREKHKNLVGIVDSFEELRKFI